MSNDIIMFNELKDVKEFSVVILGVGGNLQDWEDGLRGMFTEDNLLKEPVEKLFSEIKLIKSNLKNDRKDYLFVFNSPDKINIEKLATWRIFKFPDMKWTDDFINNYKSDYIVE